MTLVKSRQKLVYCLVSLLISFSAYAHLGTLDGTVYDQATNVPIRGVIVQLTGSGKAT